MTYYTKFPSPVGTLTAVCDEEALLGLWIEGQKHYASTLREPPLRQEDAPVLQAAKVWLERYFSGLAPSPDTLPLAPKGTAFQQAVWQILRQIPYGQTTTYGAIAKQLGGAMSAQAIGGAVGRNPISIMIPCHRVVGADGSLTGYAGGIGNKRRLLELEGVNTAKFRFP